MHWLHLRDTAVLRMYISLNAQHVWCWRVWCIHCSAHSLHLSVLCMCAHTWATTAGTDNPDPTTSPWA